MAVPLVALVGRPNVGKSTLFNRLAGRPVSLVADIPGVTRDRIFADVVVGGGYFHIVDTGGLVTNKSDPLLAMVFKQTEIAIHDADVVVLVVDQRAGLMPDDTVICERLRKAGKNIVVAVNKCEGHDGETKAIEFFQLGLDNVLPVSAEHALGINELMDAILAHIQPVPETTRQQGGIDVRLFEEEEENAGGRVDEKPEGVTKTKCLWRKGPIRVAVLGRPNVGKSSLVNRLLGEERLLTNAQAGTTRDPVNTEIIHDDQLFVFVDTAGLRRKSHITWDVERYAAVRAVRSLDEADVALLVLDASLTPSVQDAKIAALVEERGKALLLVVNKVDVLAQGKDFQAYRESVRDEMMFVRYAPVLRVSAKTGMGVNGLFEHVVQCQKERFMRVSTGELNRFFETVVADDPPPIYKGHKPRLYFVSQPHVAPPTFVFMCRHANYVADSYKRYLENALRERYGFKSTPVWIKLREKGEKAK